VIFVGDFFAYNSVNSNFYFHYFRRSTLTPDPFTGQPTWRTIV